MKSVTTPHALTRRQVTLAPVLALLAAAVPIASLAQADKRNPLWAQPVLASQNLFSMTPTLFRSAQPIASNTSLLQSLGIRTVVSLRAFNSDARALKDSSINQVRIKIYTWHITDREVVNALRAIKAAEAVGPVLLHCMHGADRTGLVSAMYRMLYQGWSREQALDELQNGGYGYHAMWRNIPQYLQHVDIEKVRLLVDKLPVPS